MNQPTNHLLLITGKIENVKNHQPASLFQGAHNTIPGGFPARLQGAPFTEHKL